VQEGSSIISPIPYESHADNLLQTVKKANVNIFDFVRVQQAGGGDLSAIKYPSKTKLRRDMQENPYRRFPLKKAKANELLTAMLIKV
jgi:hypothetical protein